MILLRLNRRADLTMVRVSSRRFPQATTARCITSSARFRLVKGRPTIGSSAALPPKKYKSRKTPKHTAITTTLQWIRMVRATCCGWLMQTGLRSCLRVCVTPAITMITPAFDLSQDPEYLILCIRVPYTRTSEFDLFIDGTDFKFYAKPYFLRLSLPGQVVEDGREKAKFDIDKGLFTVWVPKETTGEHFEGLQMLTSLLAPKGTRSAKPLIEDVSTGCSEGAGDADEDEDEEEFDWQVEQEEYKESSEEELGALQKYGFGNQRSGVFARLQEELTDVIDVKNPEGATAAERRRGRLEVEASDFSPDHYLADLFEDEEIKRLLKFSPWWAKLSPTERRRRRLVTVSFTDGEKEQLRKFTNRSYLLDKAVAEPRGHPADIFLCSALYRGRAQRRVTVDDQKLSGTLCWLETYSSLQDVLVSFGRRVLCYPLYRHFSMVSVAVRDTTKILQSGKAGVLKCLLDIHKVFRENDPAYILNDLYITDYCTWIQRSQHTPAASPLPQQSTLLSAEDKVNALPSASEGSRQLIQELGERVTEELNISEDSTAEERTTSRANGGGATKTEANLRGAAAGFC
ncbi:hypothetical protein F7725_016534 [Dissostichus mawsoni]|uniref:Protein SHQ1 homolog n=1 Tax=Dissostichus mawsoni TaxID=36200 RepID=A0A7J5Z3U8_DISMA|nr:hypothetical protein F7725_016534 [Dissostichus mawsoni]